MNRKCLSDFLRTFLWCRRNMHIGAYFRYHVLYWPTPHQVHLTLVWFCFLGLWPVSLPDEVFLKIDVSCETLSLSLSFFFYRKRLCLPLYLLWSDSKFYKYSSSQEINIKMESIGCHPDIETGIYLWLSSKNRSSLWRK